MDQQSRARFQWLGLIDQEQGMNTETADRASAPLFTSVHKEFNEFTTNSKALTHALNIQLFIPIAYTHCDTHRTAKNVIHKLVSENRLSTSRSCTWSPLQLQLLPCVGHSNFSAPAPASAILHVTSHDTSAGLHQQSPP
jgi:hypothetical protein